MNLYFRLLILLLKRAIRRQKLDVFDPCATSFRVSLFDLDLNFHMNNGRYLSIMDLGRIDLMLRAGVFWKFVRGGYMPVVAAETIRFRKSLEAFQSFSLETRIEAWDEKDFFMTQKFVQRGTVVAEGYIRGRFKQRGRKGSLATSEIFDLVGRRYEGPQLSALARAQLAVETELGNH